MYPVEAVLQHRTPDRCTERCTRFSRRSEMNAREDARVLHVVKRFCETSKRTCHTNHHVRVHAEACLLAELVSKNGRRCPADAGMAGRIFRMCRSREQRGPCRVWCCQGVPIIRCLANSCNRPPEVVSVLRIPASDGRIGHGDGEFTENSGVFHQRGMMVITIVTSISMPTTLIISITALPGPSIRESATVPQR